MPFCRLTLSLSKGEPVAGEGTSRILHRDLHASWMGGSSPHMEKVFGCARHPTVSALAAAAAAGAIRSGMDLCRKYIRVADTNRTAITI